MSHRGRLEWPSPIPKFEALMDDRVMAGANVIINNWLALQPDEKFLVIYDDKYALEAEALKFYAEKAQAKVKLVRFNKPRKHRSDLNGIFEGADVAIGVTDYSLLTTHSVQDAVNKGLRYLSFPPVTLDGRSILGYDFIQEDLNWANQTGQKLVEVMKSDEEVHITTPAGTDLRFRYRGREPKVMTGNCQRSGDIASSSLEFYIPVEEDQTEGTLILDGAMGQIGPLTQPLKIVYEQGKIVSIGDGTEGERLRRYIASFNDERTLAASEFGIGLNRLGQCLGRCYIEDESALSTCHIGHGRNLTLGGVLDAEGHYDLIMLKPTISVGPNNIMHDGQLSL